MAPAVSPGTFALDPTDPTGVAREAGHRWVGSLWVVVGLFALVMFWWSHHVGITVKDPEGRFFYSRIAISVVVFSLLAVIEASLRPGLRGWTWQRTTQLLRSRWSRKRLALTWLALLAYHLTYLIYHNLKSWDVLNEPKDAMLLRWDEWLFFGHSPNVLLHDLLGRDVAMYVLIAIYESFSTIVTISFVAALVLIPRLRDGYVFIASAMWTWILGTASYYAIPSLGPFDSAPEQFAGLPHTMIQETQARYMAQRAHLLADPSAADAFAQVSAFASLHVGLVTMLLLMARYYGLRRITMFFWFYLAGTILATVYLGWHFFVDDIAGVLIAVAAVRIGRWMIYPGGEARWRLPSTLDDQDRQHSREATPVRD